MGGIGIKSLALRIPLKTEEQGPRKYNQKPAKLLIPLKTPKRNLKILSKPNPPSLHLLQLLPKHLHKKRRRRWQNGSDPRSHPIHRAAIIIPSRILQLYKESRLGGAQDGGEQN
jgi:hypothetical protein